MAMLRHNKKWNVGLCYEFLARYLAEAILENNDSAVKTAKGLVQERFAPGTNLNKELRLFKALYETKVSSRETALALMAKVREAAVAQDIKTLEREKTKLVSEITTLLGEGTFNRQVNDYRTYATIQVLLNRWRSKSLYESLVETTLLEEQVVEHLLQGGAVPLMAEEVAASLAPSEINGMVVKVMAQKINAKYADVLNEEQRAMIRHHVMGDKAQLVNVISALRSRAQRKVDLALKEEGYDQDVRKKLEEVKTKLVQSPTYTNDDVCFYLGVAKLEEELSTQ